MKMLSILNSLLNEQNTTKMNLFRRFTNIAYMKVLANWAIFFLLLFLQSLQSRSTKIFSLQYYRQNSPTLLTKKNCCCLKICWRLFFILTAPQTKKISSTEQIIFIISGNSLLIQSTAKKIKINFIQKFIGD